MEALLDATGGVPTQGAMILESPGANARIVAITFEDFKRILEAMDFDGAQRATADGWPRLGFGAYDERIHQSWSCIPVARIHVLYLGRPQASIVTAERGPLDLFEKMVCFNLFLEHSKTWNEVTLDPQAPGVDTLVSACGYVQMWATPTPSPGSWVCSNQVLRARGDGILVSFAFGPLSLDLFWGTASTVEVGPLE